MLGYMPDEVDHDDRDATNNKWSNLNSATRLINCMNKSKRKDNISGVNGVNWDKGTKKWRARIKLPDKEIHLGLFNSIIEAAECRKKAEIKYGFHENHGR